MDVWAVMINRLPPRWWRQIEAGFFYTPPMKGARRRNMLNEHVHGVTTASQYPEEF